MRIFEALIAMGCVLGCSDDAVAPDKDTGPDSGRDAAQADLGGQDAGPEDDGVDLGIDTLGLPDGAGDTGQIPDAGSAPDVDLPDGLGWIALPGTDLAAACPFDNDDEFRGIEGCSAIIEDWSGGIADLSRNRLIVWGGGHGGYFGNELYALDLPTRAMIRLNDPSPPWANRDECSSQTANGDAASRHTYDGLAYIEHSDEMFVFGGAPACFTGGISNDTWTFDFATLTWQSRDPHSGGTPGARPGAVADYDSQTRLVYLHDTYFFWSYDADTNTYAMLRDHLADGQAIDYHLTGRIDPIRRLFVIIGGGEFHVINIAAGSTYVMEDWLLTGCDAVINEVYPGLAYDPDSDRMTAWAGGDSLYQLDLDQRACSLVTDNGGPGPQVGNGTNGRFRYFPSLRTFVLVNQWDQDAYLFRVR